MLSRKFRMHVCNIDITLAPFSYSLPLAFVFSIISVSQALPYLCYLLHLSPMPLHPTCDPLPSRTMLMHMLLIGPNTTTGIRMEILS